MLSNLKIKTAEFVSPKHPDKLCDRIADSILDAYLTKDKQVRTAIEVMGGHGKIYISGEISSGADIDIKSIVSKIIEDDNKFDIQINIAQQSPEIAKGVEIGGAGDQGVMFGYACIDNKDLVPQEYFLARDLNRFLYHKNPQDGKTQITLKDGTLHALVVSWANTDEKQLKEWVDEWITNHELNIPKIMHLNPAGYWSISGFDADTGLSGRKIVVDNYGPRVLVGGGAFSGKDASKVDRSAAYAARQKAISLLKEKGAQEVLVRVAYAIGEKYPVELTAYIDGNELDLSKIKEEFVPKAIIKRLSLRDSIFEQTAMWGHFGNSFKWDK